MGYRLGDLDVSRETYERLQTYSDLLKKWNPKINLVSKGTIDDLWERHIVDSAQIFELRNNSAKRWVDLGSGGGFPGLVIAILAMEFAPSMKVTLVESDKRKSAFLRTVSRETGCEANIVAERIENVPPLNADVLSARALADLDALLGFAKLHLEAKGTCLFPKGHTWEKEVDKAHESWRFSCEITKSQTQDQAVILKIEEIEHV
ncbi:16S rRNA (guanine(527)-N(7))-methyltransferase RsmG [Planktotalea sp.]|uniref:16S rRNA (guanine(527)-N(7))-methyltransferase RsmG n=1 Tax=Planktotalea sp. TaxID=2029877 RepID=UPI003D6C0AF6